MAGRRPAAARAPPAFPTAPAPLLVALPSPTLADAPLGNANFTRKPVCTTTIFAGISRRNLNDRLVSEEKDFYASSNFLKAIINPK